MINQAASDRIQERINKNYLRDSESQEKPVAIITGGQPGAGKAIITEQARSELENQGGYVLVDADEIRKYHPDYFRLLKQDDRVAANETHQDAGKWSIGLLKAGIEAKRNLIIDQTSKSPESMENLSNVLRKNGYKVELRVMATPKSISMLRIHKRYEDQKLEAGFGRFSTQENHDIAYEGLQQTIKHVDDKRLVDEIRIYDRVGNTAYSNELNPDRSEWVKKPEAAQALHFEQTKPMSQDENDYYQLLWTHLIEMKMARKAPEDEITHGREQQLGMQQDFNKDVSKSQADIDHIGRSAGLVIKNGHELDTPQKGEVIANTSHHVLVRLNPVVGVRYNKAGLNTSSESELEPGQQLSVNNQDGGLAVNQHNQMLEQENRQQLENENQQRNLDR